MRSSKPQLLPPPFIQFCFVVHMHSFYNSCSFCTQFANPLSSIVVNNFRMYATASDRMFRGSQLPNFLRSDEALEEGFCDLACLIATRYRSRPPIYQKVQLMLVTWTWLANCKTRKKHKWYPSNPLMMLLMIRRTDVIWFDWSCFTL